MKRWAGIAAAVMLGMSLSLTGCGKVVNKGPSAPLVKTIVIGEDAKDAKDTFSGTCTDSSSLRLLSRQAGESCSAMSQAGSA